MCVFCVLCVLCVVCVCLLHCETTSFPRRNRSSFLWTGWKPRRRRIDFRWTPPSRRLLAQAEPNRIHDAATPPQTLHPPHTLPASTATASLPQVLVIAFSFVALNGEVATPINIVGIVIVVVASTRYSMLSVAERNRPPRAAEPVSSSGSVPLLPTTWTSERDAVERAT